MITPVRLSLFLCLVHLKLMLKLVKLVDNFVLFPVELLFCLSISQLRVLSSLAFLPEALSFEVRLIGLRLQVPDLLRVFLRLDLARVKLCLSELELFRLPLVRPLNLLELRLSVDLLLSDDVELTLAFTDLCLVVQLKVL